MRRHGEPERCGAIHRLVAPRRCCVCLNPVKAWLSATEPDASLGLPAETAKRNNYCTTAISPGVNALGSAPRSDRREARIVGQFFAIRSERAFNADIHQSWPSYIAFGCSSRNLIATAPF
jgi:hypothetical protein